MDPVSASLLLNRKPASGSAIGSLYWEGSNDTSVYFSQNFATAYTTLGESNGYQTCSNLLPDITSEGFYFDVSLEKGFSSSPTEVAWLGLTNTTLPFTYSSSSVFVGWYWNGPIFSPAGNSTDVAIPLNAGKYRIAVRQLPSGIQMGFFSFSQNRTRGPFTPPPGPLRLMMLGQGGYKMPGASIEGSLAGGLVFPGGGGVF